MKKNYSMDKKIKVDLTKFVLYNKETNLAKCLAPRCKTVLTGKKKFAIQRHYRVKHNINIEDEQAENVEIVFDNSIIYNSDVDCESNQPNQLDETDEMDLLVSMEQEKPYKKFIVADYVDYRPTEDISKCLIKNCERGMSGRRTGNIKRHYHRVHKFIIVHNDHNDDSDELEDYYENEEFDNSELENEDFIKYETDKNEVFIKTETDSNIQLRFSMILEKFVNYDPLTNKSRCLVYGCKRYLEGKKFFNIKRHYFQVHNSEIDTNTFELKKLKSKHRRKVAPTKKSSIHAEELVLYDKETYTYQCLFINCNLILEKNLPIIKKHYRECHKIIIAKDSDGMDGDPLLKKRKYQHTYLMQQQQQQHDYYVDDEHLTDAWYDQNHFDEEQPHCSTSNNREYSPPKKISEQLDVTITKHEFLKLCLGLVIERDLPLSLFDDNVYFKPLLAPYNQLFNGHLNTSVMESIVSKAHNIIVADLKERFTNKVVSMELIVVYHKGGYYVVFNIRYIQEEVIYNKIIDELAENVEIVEFDNSVIHNSDVDSASNQGNKNDENGEDDSGMDLLVSMGLDKTYKKFASADYIDYYPYENISKCLIKNCEKNMCGRRTGNIKRHYHRVHKFLIVQDSDELKDYSENEEVDNSEQETDDFFKCEPDQTSLPSENEASVKTDTETDANIQQRFLTVLEKYVDYDPISNKSLCMVPACERYLEGKQFVNIKRHYVQVHNCEIDTEKFELKKLKSTHQRKVSPTNKSSVNAKELVAYDKATNTYQCLFLNCNLVLEKNLSVIKKHYRKRHKIIIAKYSPENVKKRKFRHRDDMLQQHDYYVDDDPLIDAYGHNDYVNDNFAEGEPHSSRSKKKKTSLQLDVTITKDEFFKLCLRLVIERDLPLSLFDDNDYFKPLLTPYEHLFDCHLNASVMKSILSKAHDIIVGDLKEKFANKIVCMELVLVHHNDGYYVVFNMRYIDQEVIHNKIIGVTPYNNSTDRLPITKYLRKFGIDDDQVYMKSLTTTSSQPYESELNTICYKICDYNCDAVYSPMFELQELLNIFILKFKDDIMKWQQIAEFDDKLFMDTMGNFKRFKVFVENLNENLIQNNQKLQNPIEFMKTIQICWNLMEKMYGDQYVVGDFYRDLLCCELELKKLMKLNNSYAGELIKEISKYKLKLLKRDEFLTALYLDPRFTFLGSQILSDEQKAIAKNFLVGIHEKFEKFLPSFSGNNDNIIDNDNETNDDEYALLEQHINETMPLKGNICLRDKLNNCMSTKREPFNSDILKYWRYNRGDMELNQLSQIAFSFPISQYVLKNIEKDFMLPINDMDKFDKFLIKHNYDILERNIDYIFESLE